MSNEIRLTDSTSRLLWKFGIGNWKLEIGNLFLALALFMFFYLTNDEKAAVPFDDLTVLTHFFYGRTYLHPVRKLKATFLG